MLTDMKNYRSLNLNRFLYKPFSFRVYRLVVAKWVELERFFCAIQWFWHNATRFDRSWYIINRKFIVKDGLEIHEHFLSNIMNIKPAIKVFNFWGSKGKKTNFALGLHPDMEIKIFPNSEIVCRKFKQPVINTCYGERRALMQAYLPGPPFKLKSPFEFEEKLLPGKKFEYSALHKTKFHFLLQRLCDLSLDLNSRNSKASGSACLQSLVKAYAEMLQIRIPIDQGFLTTLLTTQFWVPSKGSDLAGQNLILLGDELVAIDWEPKELKYRPYWSDIVNLIIRTDLDGLFRGSYTKKISYLIKGVTGYSPDLNEAILFNTLVAASSFWNLPILHFLDFENLSVGCFDTIIDSVSVAHLRSAAVTCEILCQKNAL
jgi:hypothetical protein